MKVPGVSSNKSDFIMVVLFLSVVMGLVAKGVCSMSNNLEVPDFLDMRNDQEDLMAQAPVMNQELK